MLPPPPVVFGLLVLLTLVLAAPSAVPPLLVTLVYRVMRLAVAKMTKEESGVREAWRWRESGLVLGVLLLKDRMEKMVER